MASHGSSRSTWRSAAGRFIGAALAAAARPDGVQPAKGPLVQRVQISPEMCGSLLQYAAPVLAGATTAQGTFSIDLDDCRIPIGDLNKANVTGRFTIHSMAVGPGRMTHELATFLNRETPAQLRQRVGHSFPSGQRPGVSREPRTDLPRHHDPQQRLGRDIHEKWTSWSRCRFRRNGRPATRCFRKAGEESDDFRTPSRHIGQAGLDQKVLAYLRVNSCRKRSATSSKDS